MKKWKQFLEEREGLADIGDDQRDDFDTIEKAVRIIWDNDPDSLIHFLRKTGKNMPELDHILDKIKSPEEPVSHQTPKSKDIVTTPMSDTPSGPNDNDHGY